MTVEHSYPPTVHMEKVYAETQTVNTQHGDGRVLIYRKKTQFSDVKTIHHVWLFGGIKTENINIIAAGLVGFVLTMEMEETRLI